MLNILKCCVLSFNLVAICGWQLLFGRYQADEQAWVDTIKSVGNGGTVRISTMDWLGQSQYMKQTVYWPSLSSAISKVTSKSPLLIFLKHCYVYCYN
jgi:ADP-ribosylglycohydrolase